MEVGKKQVSTSALKSEFAALWALGRGGGGAEERNYCRGRLYLL